MQEITHDLAQLTEATSKLLDDLGRLVQATERMAEKLGCPSPELTSAVPIKPMRRRNFKDALEAVLDTRERVARIETMIAAMEQTSRE